MRCATMATILDSIPKDKMGHFEWSLNYFAGHSITLQGHSITLQGQNGTL